MDFVFQCSSPKGEVRWGAIQNRSPSNSPHWGRMSLAYSNLSQVRKKSYLGILKEFYLLGFTQPTYLYFNVCFVRKCFLSLRGQKPEVIQLLPILKGRKFTNPNWTKSDFSCTFLHSFALTLHKITLFLHLKNCWVENPTNPLNLPTTKVFL